MRIYTHTFFTSCTYMKYTYLYMWRKSVNACIRGDLLQYILMGWLRLVGSWKLYVSFVKEPYKRDLDSTKETYNLKEPTKRSHPIPKCACMYTYMYIYTQKYYIHTHENVICFHAHVKICCIYTTGIVFRVVCLRGVPKIRPSGFYITIKKINQNR